MACIADSSCVVWNEKHSVSLPHALCSKRSRPVRLHYKQNIWTWHNLGSFRLSKWFDCCTVYGFENLILGNHEPGVRNLSRIHDCNRRSNGIRIQSSYQHLVDSGWCKSKKRFAQLLLQGRIFLRWKHVEDLIHEWSLVKKKGCSVGNFLHAM